MLEKLRERIKHLSNEAQHSIVTSVLNVLPGTEFVSHTKAKARLKTCELCENLDRMTRKCGECGCFVDEKTRIKKLPFMDIERCPQNKWL